MNDLKSYDYIVAQKIEGRIKLKKILFILAYVGFGLVFFFGLFMMQLYALMAFIVLAEWIAIYFTWPYVNVDFKYEINSGKIDFYKVYGLKKQNLILQKNIKEFTEIKPATNTADQTQFSQIDDISSSENAQDRYCATYNNDEGKPCVIYFDATQKALKLIKYYNSNTVVSDTRY